MALLLFKHTEMGLCVCPRVCAHMYLWVWVCSYVVVGVCLGWRLPSGIFLSCSPAGCFKTGLTLNMELVSWLCLCYLPGLGL